MRKNTFFTPKSTKHLVSPDASSYSPMPPGDGSGRGGLSEGVDEQGTWSGWYRALLLQQHLDIVDKVGSFETGIFQFHDYVYDGVVTEDRKRSVRRILGETSFPFPFLPVEHEIRGFHMTRDTLGPVGKIDRRMTDLFQDQPPFSQDNALRILYEKQLEASLGTSGLPRGCKADRHDETCQQPGYVFHDLFDPPCLMICSRCLSASCKESRDG